MRGVPVYTQHSVAFPNVQMFEREYEDINVSFSARGGGTHGEFRFAWEDFGPMHPGDKREHKALKIEVFDDAMLDERIMGVIQRVRRSRAAMVTPERLIEWLEEAGVRPSEYQLRGLIDRDGWRPERQAALDAALKREEARS